MTREIALAVVAEHLSDLPVGEGWPHADTADAMAMALLPGTGPGWLITLDGLVIGDCGAFAWPDASGTLEIGYGLAVAYRGRGYGTEAAKAMCDWLLAETDATVITATGIDVDNVASRRVLEKLGFKRVGDLGAHVAYRLDGKTSR